METIKELKKGTYTLLHQTYVDDFGFKKDTLEIIRMNSDGTKTLLPFFGDIKVNVKDRNDSIIDISTSYTDEEYEKMLDEQIKIFSKIK